MKKIMLSGGRPTGKLHLGHYVGAFKTFADIQEDYINYFIISDIHMLTTKNSKKDVEIIYENSLNMIIDAIGMGINPNKTTFYLQSQIPNLSYIFGIFQNYVKLDRVNNTPSLLEMSKHSKKDNISLGLAAYPVLEAADIFALNADLVPVGKDNIDHIMITQEIVKYLNQEFSLNFKVPNYITTDNNHIVGTDGSNKMSKSLDNAIYVRDSAEEVIRKVQNMKWTNPGDPKMNVVLEYIKIFNPHIYQPILEKYKLGQMRESIAKEVLADTINTLLEPMRIRMKPYLEDKEKVLELLISGTEKVRDIVDESTNNLRNGLGMIDLSRKQQDLQKDNELCLR